MSRPNHQYAGGENRQASVAIEFVSQAGDTVENRARIVNGLVQQMRGG